MKTYYTVLIPYTDQCPTKWHPTEKTGPFAVLSRGAFKTVEEAHEWAQTHLGPNHLYILKDFEGA